MKLKLFLSLCAVVACTVVAGSILASEESPAKKAVSDPMMSGFTSTTYVCHHPPGQRAKTGKVKKIVILESAFDTFPEYEQEVFNHVNDHEGDCYTSNPAVNCSDVEPSFSGGYGAYCVEN